MIGVDLFSGAGGMTLGARQAGIHVVFAVESDDHAAATYRLNHPEVNLFADKIEKLKAIPLSAWRQPTVLFGGPPCQGFSTSNQRTRSRKNDGNWMFRHFIRLARSWSPDWIVFENVKGIQETEGGLFLDLVMDRIREIGYNVSKGILNAADFGVPQNRERLFVIGRKNGNPPPFPIPIARKIPLRRAISDLPELANGADTDILNYKTSARSDYAKSLRNGSEQISGNLVTCNAPYVVRRYAHVPQGGNWENIPKNMMRNYADRTKCHTGIYHRLHPDRPSIVIGNYRKNMLIHPDQDRGLSVREAARIQSFPDTYKFTGSIGFQQQQVGNAVPPLLAQQIFATILSA